jgi:hypothetical protein
MVFVLSGKWQVQRLDAAGIPMQYYPRLRKAYYNPVYVAMLGLSEWEALSRSTEFDYFLQHYQTLARDPSADSAASAAHFIAIADWLVEHQVERKSGAGPFTVWEYDFPWALYQLRAPWVSGMAQGVGIQVLVRAWRLTGQPRYRAAAISASRAFEVEVNDGGVTYKDSPESWWYEEYAAPKARESRVLNGMEHALLGLQDLANIGSYPEAQPLIDRGLRSLNGSIDHYDLGWWTYYDLVGTIANRKYQLVNVGLTEALGEGTGSLPLKHAAARWASYRTPFFEREFIRQRADHVDVGVLLGNAGLIWLLGLVAALLARRAWPTALSRVIMAGPRLRS